MADMTPLMQAKRIGLFGGSFDPVHYGHLALAETAQRVLGLDTVHFIPLSRSPSPRKSLPVADGRQRLEMLRLAIARQEHFAVMDVELRRDGPSYTLDTIRAAAKAYPGAALFFLVGGDRAASVSHWRGISEMRELCRFAAITRAGADDAPIPDWMERVAMPPIELSSTMVREHIRAGGVIESLIPSAVIAHIRKEGLYGLRQ